MSTPEHAHQHYAAKSRKGNNRLKLQIRYRTDITKVANCVGLLSGLYTFSEATVEVLTEILTSHVEHMVLSVVTLFCCIPLFAYEIMSC